MIAKLQKSDNPPNIVETYISMFSLDALGTHGVTHSIVIKQSELSFKSRNVTKTRLIT